MDDRIIRKPTALTEEEFEVMKTHPAKGAAIMGAIPQLADVIPGMKHHHEKWEGGGYPDGLKGEEIPMQARIVTVADTFDAMTTTRPYQKAMEIGYVVERIKSFSGVRYDPVVVEAFLRGLRARASSFRLRARRSWSRSRGAASRLCGAPFEPAARRLALALLAARSPRRPARTTPRASRRPRRRSS